MVQNIFTERYYVNFSNLLLSFKIANQVLSHLTWAIIHEDELQYDNKKSDIFSEKDAFSIAGNYTGENNSLPEHTYVPIIDHGDLLKVDEIVFSSTIYSSTLHVNVRSFFLKQAIKNLTFTGSLRAMLEQQV